MASAMRELADETCLLFPQKKLAATSVSAASLFVSKCVSLSERDRAVAHATRSAEGSQGCREDADDDLQDSLPSFFLHCRCVFLGE